jgi:hypothetical protein
MRHVYEDRDEAAARGRKAAAVIQRSLAWERILPLYLERMARLVGMVAPVSKQI